MERRFCLNCQVCLAGKRKSRAPSSGSSDCKRFGGCTLNVVDWKNEVVALAGVGGIPGVDSDWRGVVPPRLDQPRRRADVRAHVSSDRQRLGAGARPVARWSGGGHRHSAGRRRKSGARRRAARHWAARLRTAIRRRLIVRAIAPAFPHAATAGAHQQRERKEEAKEFLAQHRRSPYHEHGAVSWVSR